MRRKYADLVGHRFGYLTVIGLTGWQKGHRLGRVRCDCGVEKELCLEGCVYGRTKSCGCKTAELSMLARQTHGMKRRIKPHPAYAVWVTMRSRCYDPSRKNWHNYGGRGITVCDRWQESFENFWEDMGPTYRRGLTIERRDNSKGYCPENCYWATPKIQGRNKRNNRIVATPWGEMTLAEASERSGIHRNTLHNRLSRTSDLSLIFSGG